MVMLLDFPSCRSFTSVGLISVMLLPTSTHTSSWTTRRLAGTMLPQQLPHLLPWVTSVSPPFISLVRVLLMIPVFAFIYGLTGLREKLTTKSDNKSGYQRLPQ